jgi:hypothetical protein
MATFRIILLNDTLSLIDKKNSAFKIPHLYFTASLCKKIAVGEKISKEENIICLPSTLLQYTVSVLHPFIISTSNCFL